MKKKFKVLLCTLVVGAIAVFGAGCSLTETLKQLMCEHDYGAAATEVTKAATCSEEGEELWTCLLCEKQETRTIEKLPHEFDEGRETKSPTCTETGEIVYTCTVCDTEKVEVQKKAPHNVVEVEAKSSTCTEDGHTEYTYCADCNQFLSPKTVVAATGHNITVEKGYAATCTETGLTNKEYCYTCGEVISEHAEIPAKGHDIETVKGYPATCTETGLTDSQYCKICGTVYREKEVIPAFRHADVDENGLCDICNMAVVATSFMTETAVEEGELVLGNWYRIYRSGTDAGFNSLRVSGVDYWFIGYKLDPLYSNNYVFNSGPFFTLDGFEVVITDEYVDFHFVAGDYAVLKDGVPTGDTITIDETTKITSFAIGDSVYRLVLDK